MLLVAQLADWPTACIAFVAMFSNVFSQTVHFRAFKMCDWRIKLITNLVYSKHCRWIADGLLCYRPRRLVTVSNSSLFVRLVLTKLTCENAVFQHKQSSTCSSVLHRRQIFHCHLRQSPTWICLTTFIITLFSGKIFGIVDTFAQIYHYSSYNMCQIIQCCVSGALLSTNCTHIFNILYAFYRKFVQDYKNQDFKVKTPETQATPEKPMSRWKNLGVVTLATT